MLRPDRPLAARHLRVVSCIAASFLSSGAAVFAGDFYVDPVLGNDGAAGTSSQTAWRTLRFALGELNGGKAHTIHLLPGVHADAFALTMTDSLTLLGEEGAGVTFVQLERLRVVPSGGAVAAHTLRDLTVRGAVRGVEAIVPQIGTAVTISLEDVRFESCSIAIVADMSQGRRAVIESNRVVIDFAPIGVQLDGDVACTFEDSTIVNTIFRGIDAEDLLGTPIAPAELRLRRTRVIDTAGIGVTVGGVIADASLEDSLVAGSGGDGVLVRGLIGRLDVARSTITDNGAVGLLIQTGTPMATLEDSVVALNGSVDVRLTAVTLDARDTLVGDGSIAGPGVFSGNPQFVAPGQGDFRLRPTSPAVDRLAVSTTPDLDGGPRDVDGDLDRIAARDLGAIELRPFRLLGPALAGEPLLVEILGPSIGNATVAVAPRPLVPPAASRYGALVLDPTVAWRALRVPLPGPSMQATASFDLPLVSAGETWGLQVLIPSTVSPTGAAFSNAIEIAIE